MSRKPAVRHLVESFSGPMATVYSCPVCSRFRLMRRKGQGGGRGAGWAVASHLHAQVVAHIQTAHTAEEIAPVEAKYQARRERERRERDRWGAERDRRLEADRKAREHRERLRREREGAKP